MKDQAVGEAKMACEFIHVPSKVSEARWQNTILAVLAFLGSEPATGKKTTCICTARIIGSAIPMFMLLWIMQTGFKLVTEPRRDPTYNQLAFLFGIISIAFGVVHFINGLALVAGMMLELLDSLRWLPDEETGSDQGGHADAYSV